MTARCTKCGHRYSISNNQPRSGYICEDCEKRISSRKPIKACNLIYGNSEMARVVCDRVSA